MKKTILLCIVSLILCANNSNAQANDTTITKKGLAKAMKRQGIEVYVFSEPIKEYTVVKTISDVDWTDASNAITDALNGTKTVRCKNIREQIDIMVTEAVRLRSKKKNPIDFDALLTEDGSEGSLIKFKD